MCWIHWPPGTGGVESWGACNAKGWKYRDRQQMVPNANATKAFPPCQPLPLWPVLPFSSSFLCLFFVLSFWMRRFGRGRGRKQASWLAPIFTWRVIEELELALLPIHGFGFEINNYACILIVERLRYHPPMLHGEIEIQLHTSYITPYSGEESKQARPHWTGVCVWWWWWPIAGHTFGRTSVVVVASRLPAFWLEPNPGRPAFVC